MQWLWWALGALFVFGILPSLIVSYLIYSLVLVRTKPSKWGRECSFPEDEEYVRLFNDALSWREKYRGQRRETEVVSDGLRLKGEYYDFGGKDAVIIIPGRTESLLYSGHFAEPYRAMGMNVLLIDNRSHGLSEGKYVSLGFKEYRDILQWARLLHDKLGNEGVLLHGVCIGSSVALFALVSPDCPDYLRGMTADGMYVNFYESFRLHMIEQKRPLFPFLRIIMWYIRIFAGADVVHDGPEKRMPLLTKPILFLHSREDGYSLPEKAEVLYNLCRAEKQLVWFPTGAHSRLRINHTEEYDRAVRDFWSERINKTPGK